MPGRGGRFTVPRWMRVPWMVCNLLRGSARSQDALWGMVESGGLDYAALTPDDAPGIRQLMQRYRDQPMDLVDAALVHVAERDGLRQIFTLDRRHFEIYRIKRRTRFTLVA